MFRNAAREKKEKMERSAKEERGASRRRWLVLSRLVPRLEFAKYSRANRTVAREGGKEIKETRDRRKSELEK